MRAFENREYSLSFKESGATYEIVNESYGTVFARQGGHYSLGPRSGDLPPNQSILSEIRHPGERELTELVKAFEGIRLYREFSTGPASSLRNGVNASSLGDHLREDGGNLALVLNEFNVHRGLERMRKYLLDFYELLEEVLVVTRGGITQVYVRENGIPEPLAATSLSDGTLRFLCLLAVLLDPNPPPLICLEEPETGLHPDAIRTIAELLIEASERTQLVVTTHSPALVDAFTAQPESVLVCERDFDGFTTIQRLQRQNLDAWLEEYSLGDLWQKGEIGGNRW